MRLTEPVSTSTCKGCLLMGLYVWEVLLSIYACGKADRLQSIY